MFQVARRVDCVLRASVKEVGFVPVEEGAEVGCGLEVDRGVVVESCGGLSWSGGRSSCGSWVVSEHGDGSGASGACLGGKGSGMCATVERVMMGGVWVMIILRMYVRM